MRRVLLAGNWKMHKTRAELPEFFQALTQETGGFFKRAHRAVDVLVAPSFTLLDKTRELCTPLGVHVAAQNVHAEPAGAFTGEVSLPMLAEMAIHWVILGHSERRQYFNETDAAVAAKTRACLVSGATPIVCVGESRQQREAGKTAEVITAHMRAVLEVVPPSADWVVAYEPVWAIGTGLTATKEQAQEVHALIRKLIKDRLGPEAAAKTRILYGGSVKPENIGELLREEDVDGCLIGGASLKPSDMAKMIKTACS